MTVTLLRHVRVDPQIQADTEQWTPGLDSSNMFVPFHNTGETCRVETSNLDNPYNLTTTGRETGLSLLVLSLALSSSWWTLPAPGLKPALTGAPACPLTPLMIQSYLLFQGILSLLQIFQISL